MTERRAMTLTDADIAAIKLALAEHQCRFDEQTRVSLQILSKADANVLLKLATAYTDATNYIWKGLLALALVGCVLLALLGAGIKLPVISR